MVNLQAVIATGFQWVRIDAFLLPFLRDTFLEVNMAFLKGESDLFTFLENIVASGRYKSRLVRQAG